MNWVGINLSKTIGVDNQIIEIEIKRKIYKKNRLEIGTAIYVEAPYSFSESRATLTNYNQKIGLTLDVNYILNDRSYIGLGIQTEKYFSFRKISPHPRIANGYVISKDKHIVLECFLEFNKVYDSPGVDDPSLNNKQIFERMDYKTTFGIAIKKAVFYPKKDVVKTI